AIHPRPPRAPGWRRAPLRGMPAGGVFEDLCRAARLDALASSRDLRHVLFCERRRAELRAEELQPPRLLTGADLLTMGYAAGPRIGEILRLLEDAQLEGEVTSRAAAETFVRERFPLASERGSTTRRRGQVLDPPAHAVAGRTTRRQRAVLVAEGGTRDVEMRPGHAGDELAEEKRGGDGAGVAAADVLQIGDAAPQLLAILAHERELPEKLSRVTAAGDQ